MSIIFDTYNRLERIKTFDDYNLVLKKLYGEVLEEFRLFLMDDSYFKKYEIKETKVFKQFLKLKSELLREVLTDGFTFSSEWKIKKELDEEIIFRNIIAFFGSEVYYRNLYGYNQWIMWYHILNKLPIGPHACPLYLNGACRSCTCNSISNLCDHPEGKKLNMSFWTKELRELVGLVYNETIT